MSKESEISGGDKHVIFEWPNFLISDISNYNNGENK